MARTTGSATTTVATSAVLGFLLAGVVVVALAGHQVPSTDTVPDTATDAPPASTSLREDPGFTVWAVDADGTTVRWDPCTPIDVVLESTGAPPSAEADLAQAIATIRDASGLDIRLIGTTDERPSASRAPYQPDRYGERWAPVLVAWVAPGEDGLPLAALDRGVAVPVAIRHQGARTFVTGQVVLNVERVDLVAGFGDRRDAWGATLVHELGHLVGLGHVEDVREMMSTDPGTGAVELGPGDRDGLVHIGGGGTCRERPPPGPVTAPRPDADAPTGVRPGA